MLKKYGQEVIDELEANEFIIKKWTVDELLELIDKYKALVYEISVS
jgi:hypothetical protein